MHDTPQANRRGETVVGVRTMDIGSYGMGDGSRRETRVEPARKETLAHSLKQRHVVMLSIGGSIGAGLFVGSGHAIAEAGPAAIVAYVLASLLVVLVMRMLGEMACAMPDSGSFSTYAGKAIGPWAGFMIGWMYWWFWVLVLPIEATAAANILNSWFPQIEMWKFCLAVTFLLTVANLASVKHYGELEFWFSVVKVTAIVIFIACGAAALVGLIPHVHVNAPANLFGHGGFAPNGWAPIAGAMLTTMFTFLGTEVVTIAAAESKDPAREISRAITSVVWRISLFYIGSIGVIISILPWNDPALTRIGSYQAVLQALHVPYAKLMIDSLILVAVCSCLNSGLYTASRMIFSLGARGQAPAVLTYTNRAGVPVFAVLASTLAAFAGVAANYLAPSYVFEALLSTTGSIALLVYMVIAVSQLRMRARFLAQEKLKVRMWLHPFLGLFVVLLIIGALAVMVSGRTHRGEVVATLGLSALLACIGALQRKRRAGVSLK